MNASTATASLSTGCSSPFGYQIPEDDVEPEAGAYWLERRSTGPRPSVHCSAPPSEESAERFIAVLGHELRNPLAPISTGLEILKRDKTNGPASLRAREMMERNLQHMVRLIDGLLDSSRIRTGKVSLDVQPTSITRLLDEALDGAQEKARTYSQLLEISSTEPDLQVLADATRLAQVFAYVVDNAMKFTPRGGSVHVKSFRRGGMAIVEVQDSGIGMSPAVLRNIFSLFFQGESVEGRLNEGLGVGLHLARGFVELHGGRLIAESAGLNRGSTFRIELPACT